MEHGCHPAIHHPGYLRRSLERVSLKADRFLIISACILRLKGRQKAQAKVVQEYLQCNCVSSEVYQLYTAFDRDRPANNPFESSPEPVLPQCSLVVSRQDKNGSLSLSLAQLATAISPVVRRDDT